MSASTQAMLESAEPARLRSLTEIARLEEARCAQGTSEVALESIKIAGGIASRGEPKSWINTAVGIGMAGPVESAEIDHLIDWYEQAGHEPQIEFCPFADESLAPLLSKAGFRIERFEQLFFRELAASERIESPHAAPTDVELRIVPADNGARVREAATVITVGFTPIGATPREDDIQLFERCARHARSVCVGAYREGICIGGGFVEFLGELSALYGLAVSAAARRQGIQQALIAARLNLAIERGCSLATISGPPGMGTERNVRRFGFQVAYTKAIVRKPRPIPFIERAETSDG